MVNESLKKPKSQAWDIVRDSIASGKDPETFENLSDAMRRRVKALLEKTNELIEQLKLREQYVSRLDTLKVFGFLDENGQTKKGDAPLPSASKVLSSFTLDELRIAKKFAKPTLIIQPEVNFARLAASIDAQRKTLLITVDKSYFLNEYGYYQEAPDWHRTCSIDDKSDKISNDLSLQSDQIIPGWRTVIADGVWDKIDQGPRFKKDLETRIREMQSKKDARGMDLKLGCMLIMEGRKTGDLFDNSSDAGNRVIVLGGETTNFFGRILGVERDSGDGRHFYTIIVKSSDGSIQFHVADAHDYFKFNLRQVVGGAELIK